MKEELTPPTLMSLDSRQFVTNGELQAVRKIMFLTLRLLHERGTLPLQVVVRAIESQQYLFAAGHDYEPDQFLQVLTDQLRQIADAYGKRP
jgi:hypothetical protein